MSTLPKAVVMTPPKFFRSNEQTRKSNAFQGVGAESGSPAPLDEFNRVVAALRNRGVRVVLLDPVEDAPDAVFPNNWFSSHQDGTLVIYPMEAENRRRERQALPQLQELLMPSRVLDLSGYEQRGQYLEGTGSMVLDREAGYAYAATSSRTHSAPLREFCERLDFTPVEFAAYDEARIPIYHTNVILSLGESYAVLCTDALADPKIRDRILERRSDALEITYAQMRSFCANILQLEGPLVVLSETARRAYTPSQIRVLERHGDLLCVDVATIERLGGGGVRCMLAEAYPTGDRELPRQ
jgi:hypothetical protein